MFVGVRTRKSDVLLVICSPYCTVYRSRHAAIFTVVSHLMYKQYIDLLAACCITVLVLIAAGIPKTLL